MRRSGSSQDRENGKQCAPLGKELADQLELLFPDEDDECTFIIPAPDSRSQILSVRDRRNGVGKPVFKLAPLCSGQKFTIISPDLLVLGVSLEMLQRILSLKPIRSMCDGVEVFFCVFLVPWVLHLALSLIRGVVKPESSSCSREDAVGDCGRPSDPFLAFFSLLCGNVAANL